MINHRSNHNLHSFFERDLYEIMMNYNNIIIIDYKYNRI